MKQKQGRECCTWAAKIAVMSPMGPAPRIGTFLPSCTPARLQEMVQDSRRGEKDTAAGHWVLSMGCYDSCVEADGAST